MKKFLAVLFAGGVLFFASCKNGSNDPLPIFPVPDSASNGSYLSTWYFGNAYFMKDLSLNGIPTIYMHAYDTYNETDSIWEFTAQLFDAPKTRCALFIKAKGNSAVGDFTVTDNSSTFTDYTNGENKAYSIKIGSVIHVSQAVYPITGTMDLTLYYNKATAYANDSFKINN